MSKATALETEGKLSKARLIAAAPRLLEEMKRFLVILETAEKMPFTWDWITHGTGIATANSYRAAIRAAEGEV